MTGNRTQHITRALRTQDEAEALRRFPLVKAEITRELEAARRNPDGSRKDAKQTPAEVANWWRTYMQEEGIDPAEAMQELGFSEHMDELVGDPLHEDTDERGERRLVYDSERLAYANEIIGRVTGAQVPLDAELERYLTAEAISPSYASRIRRAVRLLSDWARDHRCDNIRSISRYQAGRFAEHLGETCQSPKTAISLLSALSAYWAWLGRKGLAERHDNPWRDQAPAKRNSPANAEPRAFTDAEVAKLLAGDTYSTLHDLMRIAALSGARLNEIGRLMVRDCTGGLFDIRDGKTSNSVRKVPIHPGLKPIIARRSKDKEPDAYLFDELKARKDDPRRRANKAGERFTAYRRTLKIEEKGEGQTRSNVDFHSFRRWFVTKAEQADQPPHVISAVVGHAEWRKGMTLGTYGKEGPSVEQRRAVVESVRLPKDAPADKADGPRMGDGRAAKVAPAAN